jgi:hypothetical protein
MTGREKMMAVICVLVLLLTNLATFNHARAGCPDQEIKVVCPNECPKPCPDPCPDVNLTVPEVVHGDGVDCYVIATDDAGRPMEYHCVVKEPAEPDCPEVEVEIERRHGVKLGPGYTFHDNSDAVGLKVQWDPKWLDQRSPWVPTTISFGISEDIGDYVEPEIAYDYGHYQSMARCSYCPTPTLDWQQPDGTSFTLDVLWTAK